jgi:hypothetical protein
MNDTKERFDPKNLPDLKGKLGPLLNDDDIQAMIDMNRELGVAITMMDAFEAIKICYLDFKRRHFDTPYYNCNE